MRVRLVKLGIRELGPNPNSATHVNNLFLIIKFRLGSNDPYNPLRSSVVLRAKIL